MEIIESINYENPIVKRFFEIQNAEKPINENPLDAVRALFSKKDKHLLTMGELFGSKITSRHNQNCILNIVGKQGMGKSNASLYIAIETAKWIAHKMGGKPEDYFTLNNCAIMELETIIPIMKTIDVKRYNIFILDDIGASYGARDYNDVVNKNFNKILQTFRDSNTLLILTMPDDFLIDKVPRKLAHYQLEMTTQIFHKNVSLGKLSEVKELYKIHKTIYPFVQQDGIKYTRCLFKKVPEEIHTEYNRLREIVRKKMTNDCISSIEDSKNLEPKEKKIPKYIEMSKDVQKFKSENPNMSQRKIAEQFNCDPVTIGRALKYSKTLSGE